MSEAVTFCYSGHTLTIAGMGEDSPWIETTIAPRLTAEQTDRFFPRGIHLLAFEEIEVEGEAASRMIMDRGDAFELIGADISLGFNPERYAARIMAPLNKYEIAEMNLR